MENRKSTNTQNARSKMRATAGNIRRALENMQRGRADQSAVHFASGFDDIFQAMEELAQAVDRLEQEKTQ